MAHPAIAAALLIGALAVAGCAKKVDENAIAGYGAGGSAAYGASNPASPEYFKASVGDRVLFPVDQSTLTAEAQQTLNGQAAWLNQNTVYNATVEGHADEQGTREYNLALGARRANAVQEYLISRGVAGSRVNTVSYGKERPLEICSEESCYARNRRAVTLVRAAPSS